MHMRTTLNIDSGLLKEASKLTGISEKTALVRMGLKALIAKESADGWLTLVERRKSCPQSLGDDRRGLHDTR